MNQADLVARIAELIKTHSTHTTLSAECAAIGLVENVPQEEGCSKHQRAIKRLEGKSAREVAIVAEQARIRYKDFELEEAALHFLEAGRRPLTEITRRDIQPMRSTLAYPSEILLEPISFDRST